MRQFTEWDGNSILNNFLMQCHWNRRFFVVISEINLHTVSLTTSLTLLLTQYANLTRQHIWQGSHKAQKHTQVPWKARTDKIILNKNRHSFDACRFTLLSVPLLSPGTEFPKRDSVYMHIMLIIAKLYELLLVTTIKTIKNVVLPLLFFFVLKWNKFKWWDQNNDTDIKIYERWRTSSRPMVEGVAEYIAHLCFNIVPSYIISSLYMSWTSTKCSTAVITPSWLSKSQSPSSFFIVGEEVDVWGCQIRRFIPAPRIKCWNLRFQQITSMLTFVHVIGYVPHWHVNQKVNYHIYV